MKLYFWDIHQQPRHLRFSTLRTKIVVESIQVAFDDRKVEGIHNEESHDKLEFENLKTLILNQVL